jgi:hypothetical protein
MFKWCTVPLAALVWIVPSVASAQSFEADVAPLVESSCLRCHGPRTATPLNLSELGHELSDHAWGDAARGRSAT